MRSEDLSVALRRRSPWEALDLGAAMVRQWWRSLYGAWLLVFLPATAVLVMVFGPSWGTFALWLLKPLFDRVALHVLATAVFATPPTPKQTLQALRKRLGPGVLWSLTLRRLDPARSFNLPIAQLEGQSSAEGRARRTVLHRFTHSYAIWLTVAFTHFEIVLFFAGLAVSDLLVPASSKEGASFFSALFEGRFDQASEFTWFSAISYVVTVAILEPIYVASGFALYLNRRTLLEGWDLEVQFRRLAETLRAASLNRATALTFLTICGLLSLGLNGNEVRAQSNHSTVQTTPTNEAPSAQTPPAQAAADEAENVAPVVEAEPTNVAEQPTPPRAAALNGETGKSVVHTNEEVQARATEILKAPEFGKTEEVTRLRYTGPRWQPKKADNDTSRPWDLGLLPSELFRALAYLVLAIALGYIAIIIYRNLRANSGAGAAPYRAPETLFGLDVRPESLPDDVRAAALQLARAGELRGALALLYRASLMTLIQKDQVQLQSSDTEHECLNRASTKLSEPRLVFFTKLVTAWERVAYAQEPIAVDSVLVLCEAWPATFEAESA